MDFYKEVIESSREVPVVVDFWAPWCGPCQFLGPVIEQLAAEAGNRWKLVKVNTDEYPEISRQYHIQGIPAVKMFYDEEVVADFTGALPKHQIEKWLEQNLPDKRKKELVDIINKISEDSTPNLEELEAFIHRNPDFTEGKIELASRLVLQDPVSAAEMVADIRAGSPFHGKAEDIRALEKLTTCNYNENENLALKMMSGRDGMRDGDLDQTLQSLIEAIMLDKSYCDELPRKAVLAIFNLLGSDHELTKKYRKRFDMALY